MKILFYNIAYSTGMNGTLKSYFGVTWRFLWLSKKVFNKIVTLFKKETPDIICLAEVDGGSFRNQFKSQAKAFSIALDYPHIYSKNKYHPRSIWHWMTLIGSQHDAILSKHSGHFKSHYFSRGIQRHVSEFQVKGMSIFVVHLAVLRKKMRARQLRELANIVKKCKNPYIVCGDFNVHNGHHELDEFIQKTNTTLVKTPHTFPSHKPNRTIDLFLVDATLEVKGSGIISVNHSDHLPVWIELA